MQSALAELSSVGSQLEELTRRVVGTAEAFDADGHEHVAHELYEVERALKTASRRLQRATRDAQR